jgi:hypothetical protein
VIELQWESTSGRSDIAQIIVRPSRVNDVLAVLHGGPSGGHLGVNKTLSKIRQRYCWLQARNDVEKLCWHCDACATNRGQMHQYNVRVSFERIAIDLAGPFSRLTQGNRYLLIPMDYFTK